MVGLRRQALLGKPPLASPSLATPPWQAPLSKRNGLALPAKSYPQVQSDFQSGTWKETHSILCAIVRSGEKHRTLSPD